MVNKHTEGNLTSLLRFVLEYKKVPFNIFVLKPPHDLLCLNGRHVDPLRQQISLLAKNRTMESVRM